MDVMRYLKIFLPFVLMTACNVTTPSQISVHPIELHDRFHTKIVEVSFPDHQTVEEIVKEYNRGGQGVLEVFFPATLDQRSEVNKKLQAWKKAFIVAGIPTVETYIFEAKSRAFQRKGVARWSETIAVESESCQRIPGFNGTADLSAIQKYELGCEINRSFARQVRQPVDFLGHSGFESDEAKRHGIAIEKYRSGIQNQKLQGIDASSVGTTGGGG